MLLVNLKEGHPIKLFYHRSGLSKLELPALLLFLYKKLYWEIGMPICLALFMTALTTKAELSICGRDQCP